MQTKETIWRKRMIEQQKEKKNRGLIGLRGFLVLTTALGFHYAMLYGTVPAEGAVGKKMFDIFYLFGLTAPNIFLVMSGYFMYHKYTERIRRGLGFGEYMLPRIKKIYPLMIFFTIYLFVIENIGKLQLGFYPLHADGGELRYSVRSLIVSLLGIQSGLFAEGDTMAVNGPSWFVTTLLLCYSLFFVIVKFCKNQKIERSLYVILGVIGVIFTFHPVHVPLLYECSARGLLFFFAGVIIHIVADVTGEEKRKIRIGLAAGLIVLMAAAAVAVNYNDFTVWQTYLAWPCLVCLIIESPPLQKVLALPPLVWVGERSMSVFLGNLPILTTFSWLNLRYGWKADYGSWRVWIIIFAVTLLVGEATYVMCETWIPSRMKIS